MKDDNYNGLIKQAADEILNSEVPTLTEGVDENMSELAHLRKQSAGILALAGFLQDEKLASDAVDAVEEITKLAESDDEADLETALELLEQIADSAYSDEDMEAIENGDADENLDEELASLASEEVADALEKAAGAGVAALSKIAGIARAALHMAHNEGEEKVASEVEEVEDADAFTHMRKQAAGVLALAELLKNEKLASHAAAAVEEITKLAESDDESDLAEALELLEEIADSAYGDNIENFTSGEADEEISDALMTVASVDSADEFEKIAGEGGRALAKLASRAAEAMEKMAEYEAAQVNAEVNLGVALNTVANIGYAFTEDVGKAANALELATLAKQAAAELFVEAETAEDVIFGQEKTAAPANFMQRLGRGAKRLGIKARSFARDVSGARLRMAKGEHESALKALRERVALGSYGTVELNKKREQALKRVSAAQKRVKEARRKAAIGAGVGAAGAAAIATGTYMAGKKNHEKAASIAEDIELMKQAAFDLWKEADTIEEAASEMLIPDEELALLADVDNVADVESAEDTDSEENTEDEDEQELDDYVDYVDVEDDEDDEDDEE